MRRLVIDLADARPIFRLPADVVDELRATVPDWDVVVVDSPADGTADGGPGASPGAIEAVREGAEVYMGFGVPAALLRAGRSLRWVHTGTAGVAGSLTAEMLDRDVIFTNSAGIHGPPVAETVIAYMLHFARGLDLGVRAQAERRWATERFDAADAPVRELSRSTVGVVGLGGLGREVARRSVALGATVVGTRRRAEPSGIDGVQLLSGPDALDRLLERSHYVVITAPETPRTRGMIDAAALGRMRPDAVLINVARGALIDTEALIATLRDGGLRGAALDAFREEPLPEDHPLWTTPRVLITPHTSSHSHAFWDRERVLLTENLRRYVAGRPLLNVVDKAAGY